jgi:hypothetical protein
MRPTMTRITAAFLLAAAVPAAVCAATVADSIRYVSATTDVNRVGLAITNYGFFGNNLNSRSPSLEFPLGSGYEHMSRAGLWVGAQALSDLGLFTGVSTAIVDNVQGSVASIETEFTPAGNTIQQRSRISNSRSYSPDAISDQDWDCSYSDFPAKNASGNQREAHRPLNILVRQRTLGFALEAAQDFVALRFTIINQGPPLRDVYVGFYAQFVSGDKNAYSTWPPSSTSGPGSWYYKSHIEYDAPRRLFKEHYCLQEPYPDACDFAYAPAWAGLKLLGVSPDSIAEKTVSFNWWSFSPGDTVRDEDRERYRILSNGQVMATAGCVPGGQACSPIMLLSIGPWAQVDPGDSVTVDFAVVGGDEESDFLKTADFAQFTADIDFQLPAPPPSPRVHVETGDHRADIFWDDSPERDVDPTSPAPGGMDFEGYRVYFGSDRQRPGRVAQFDLVAPPHDTTGFNTGLDAVRLDPPAVFDGIAYPYRYTVSSLRDGFDYYGAVTSYDTGDPQVTSLESGLTQNKFLAIPNPGPGESGRTGVTVFPNPYRVEARWDQGTQVRDHYLWFVNLPARCVLRIYTLSGDEVFRTRFDGATYRGDGTRGLYDPRRDLDTPAPALSGSSYAWNLITSEGQAVASGLYLFAVEDLTGGPIRRGKFLIVKSDREN